MKLSRYYGGTSAERTGADKALNEYYGDPGTGKFSTAKGVANAFAALIDEVPRYFRRSDVATKLGLQTGRELALLTDALNTLQKKGLISWSRGNNAWQNLSR